MFWQETYVIFGPDTSGVTGDCTSDDVLTREFLSGLEETGKDRVAVKVDLISTEIKASETIVNSCIL